MSAYSEKPIETFLWTLNVGYWIAITYWLLEETREGSAMVQADVFLRVAIDVVSVTVVIWVASKLSPKVVTGVS